MLELAAALELALAPTLIAADEHIGRPRHRPLADRAGPRCQRMLVAVLGTPPRVVGLDVVAVLSPPFPRCLGMAAPPPAVDAAFEPRIRPESLERTVLPATAAPFVRTGLQLFDPGLSRACSSPKPGEGVFGGLSRSHTYPPSRARTQMVSHRGIYREFAFLTCFFPAATAPAIVFAGGTEMNTGWAGLAFVGLLAIYLTSSRSSCSRRSMSSSRTCRSGQENQSTCSRTIG
jgi:hypothetical protein